MDELWGNYGILVIELLGNGWIVRLNVLGCVRHQSTTKALLA